MADKLPNPKYVPKPYEQMHYPGERIQIDVKYVPSACLVNEAKGQTTAQSLLNASHPPLKTT